MPQQSFYWVGATAASWNSFSWDTLANWKVVVPGGGGPTANPKATLVAATRLPLGGDNVNFGRPYGPSNQAMPAPFVVYSPCLFGGVTTAANKWWQGATAGGTTFEKFGSIITNIHVTYPFYQLGGQMQNSDMASWTTYLESTTGLTLATPDWTYANGVWSNSNWYGSSVSLTVSDQPSNNLYIRGAVNQFGKSVLTRLYGVTAANAGATGTLYDGTNNFVRIGAGPMPIPYSVPQFAGATAPRAEGDNMIYTTGLSGPYAWHRWGTGIAAGGVDVRQGAYTQLWGHWNYVRQNESTANTVVQNSGNINVIELCPTAQYVRGSTAPEGGPLTYQPVTPANTKYDLVSFHQYETGNARVIKIGNVDQIHSYGIRILGSVIPTGGFVCAVPAGISSGSSGGIVLPNGSVSITPPVRLGNQWDVDDLNGWTGGSTPMLTNRAVVFLGWNQGIGITGTTTITNLYAESGVTYDMPIEYSILGNYTSTNVYMNQGTLSLSEDIDPDAAVTITNLYLRNDSVFDLANAPNHDGPVSVAINAQSNATTVKPNTGTTLVIGNLWAQLTETKPGRG